MMSWADTVQSVALSSISMADSAFAAVEKSPLASAAVQTFQNVIDAVSGYSKSQVPVPGALDVASRALAKVLTSSWFPFRVPGVRLRDVALSRALIVIALAPLIWTLLARIEFRTQAASRILGRRIAAYSLAVWIFCFSLYRDILFAEAIARQPTSAFFAKPLVAFGGALLSGSGAVLVTTSMCALGIHGTYLGDYFGILMDAKVESFPFNLFDHPMYVCTHRIPVVFVSVIDH
jgi:hypothetical protein